METLTEKVDTLKMAIRVRIAAKLLEKGVESKHRNEKVLRIKKDAHMFNIAGGRYLVEITPTELIDNNGYSFGHGSISIEDLCEAIDGI